jgi:hypothetical protein
MSSGAVTQNYSSILGSAWVLRKNNYEITLAE